MSYRDLTAELRRDGRPVIVKPFAELERITRRTIGVSYRKPNVLMNQASSRYLQAALEAGYYISDVDYTRGHETMTFTRGERPDRTHRGRTSHGRGSGSGNPHKSNSQRVPFRHVSPLPRDLLKLFIYSAARFLEQFSTLTPLLTASLPPLPSVTRKRRLSIGWRPFFSSSPQDFLDPAGVLSEEQLIYKMAAFHAVNNTKNNIIKFNPGQPARVNSETYLTGVTSGWNAGAALPSIAGFKSGWPWPLVNPYSVDVVEKYYDLLAQIQSAILRSRSVSSASAARPFEQFEQSVGVSGNPTTPVQALNDANAIRAVFTSFYGEVMPYDFLKEFGRAFRPGVPTGSAYPFYDYPKPDMHVRRMMIWIYDDPTNTAPHRAYPKEIQDASIRVRDALSCHMDLVASIRDEFLLNGGTPALVERITNYVMDKLFYVLCSGNYYLDPLAETETDLSEEYYSAVANKTYAGSIVISRDMPFLDDFLSKI